ncbi:MAG: hypothetical protein U0R81_07545 [Mycobacterium sp.]
MSSGGSEGPDGGTADDLTSPEAAELAASEAEARAQAARARADELRRKLDEARGQTPASDTVDADQVDAEQVDAEQVDAEPEAAVLDEAEPETAVPTAATRRPQRLRLPRLAIVARVAGILLTAGALAVTGLMLWQHRKTADHRHLEAENVAAARQGVVNLMSIDSTAAKETVQRLIDDSTGKFQANFKDGSDDLIKAMQDAKVVTKVTVNDVAVDEIDGDTAILLVAATTERRDAQAPKEDNQPRVWRVVLTVVRDGGDIKMSDVEFV